MPRSLIPRNRIIGRSRFPAAPRPVGRRGPHTPTDAHIRALVKAAPELTAEQRALLALILNPGRGDAA